MTTTNRGADSLGVIVKTLVDGANIALDAESTSTTVQGNVIMAGNRTFDKPTNLTDGQMIIYRIEQDGLLYPLDWIERQARQWEDRLDRLDAYVLTITEAEGGNA